MTKRLTIIVKPTITIDPGDMNARMDLDSRLGQRLLDLPGIETVAHHYSADKSVLDLRPCWIAPDDYGRDLQTALGTLVSLALLEDPEVSAVSEPVLTMEPVLDGMCRVGDHPFVSPLWYPITRPLPNVCPEHAREQEQIAWDTAFSPQLTALREAGFQANIENTGGNCMCLVIPLPQFGPGVHVMLGDAEAGPLNIDTTSFGLCLYGEGEDFYEPDGNTGTDALALVRAAVEQAPGLLSNKT